MFVKKFFKVLKNEKEKKEKNEKRITVNHKEVGNIENKMFVFLFVCLKQSEKERKLMALTTNDSTNMLTS